MNPRFRPRLARGRARRSARSASLLLLDQIDVIDLRFGYLWPALLGTHRRDPARVRADRQAALTILPT